MALPELRQVHTLIDRATRVLLIVPERASLDAIASMVALYLVLQERLEDRVDEVSAQHVPTNLQFLAGSSQVRMEPEAQHEVTLDIAGPTATDSLRTTPLQGGVRVHVTLPPGSEVTKDQLETTVRVMPYDLVIVLGAADLEELGDTYTKHTDFFFSTPIINIDHVAKNEHFGTVNLVDITAGSVAEVVYELIDSMVGHEGIDANIATALYSGVVAGTDSFQRPSTTPRSFQVAARLMEKEADRDAVIQNLVKTKPLSLLKLSGRLYARLRYDEHLQLFWSMVRGIDFQESEAEREDLPRALFELANNISGFNIAFVLSEEDDNAFTAHLLLGKGLQPRREEIQERLAATQVNGMLQLSIPASSLEDAEAKALEQVRSVVP